MYVCPSVCPQILGNSFFLVNYNCDALYDHLWCPNGPEVDWKWPEVDRKWAKSGLEVSICPSVRLSIPNTSLTSLTNLMRGIYKRRALAPCDFFPSAQNCDSNTFLLISDLSHFRNLCCMLSSSLFSRPVPPHRQNIFCLRWKNHPWKEITNNVKS